jgi:isocitrate/isopropylmalate dehydrogenase
LAHQITLIAGDGIGPEITKAANKIIENEVVKIEKALAKAIEKGEEVTKDINTQKFIGTADFADTVIEEL